MDKIGQYEHQVVQEANGSGQADSDQANLDELMDELEDEDFMANYREKRMQQISDHLRSVQKNVREEGYGSLAVIEDESALMKKVAKADNAVVHFGLDTFAKCQYMDHRLNELAQKHLTTAFLRVNVDRCPFLVSKLAIKVLPFVICYKEGQEVLRIVGFSKLGNNPDHFPLSSLEALLRNKRVIDTLNFNGKSSANASDDESISEDDY